jgi:hypothetical protein
MYTLEFQLGAIKDLADKLGQAADQLPFALSQLLNDGAFKTRRVLIDVTWPRAVHVRNPGFLNWALHVDKSTKSNLEVSIVDTKNRAHLALHAKGGVKRAGRRNLAIPVGTWYRQGPHGVSPQDRPRALIDRTPKRDVRVTDRGIFVAQGGRLHMRYSFKPSINQPADVPFYEDFREVMGETMRTGFYDTMRKAIQTAK